MAFKIWLSAELHLSPTEMEWRDLDSYITSSVSDAALLLQIKSHLHWGIN